MLFKDRFQDYRQAIGIGMFLLFSGILLHQVIIPRLIAPAVQGPAGEALEIALLVVSAILIGASLVFNLHGLKVYRRSR